MASFVDRVVLYAQAGKGGHGCASVHREKFKPLGGPDGGNGGNGGSVVLEVSDQVTTLLAYHHKPHHRAANGEPGRGGNSDGKNGEDVVLAVPAGTVVKERGGDILADLTEVGSRVTIAEGGRGGLGNAALASKRRKAPGFALLGEPGEETEVVLELKSVADVALVGFPSAGKSSLIAALSSARPKIADYPFTTLVPNLGVVDSSITRFTIADVPGLIPGAAEGKGLGLDFLRHIERCAVIAHVLDAAAFENDRDPVSDLKLIEAELAEYSSDLAALPGYRPLAERQRVVIVNKIDVPDGADMAQMQREELAALGWPVVEVSAVTHAGLDELTRVLARLVAEERAAHAGEEEASEPSVIRPRALDARSDKVSVRALDYAGQRVYEVRGAKPERWVLQTDFANDEAVGYLADRLARAGVEDELAKAGARPGDSVVIGPVETGVIFDWEPSLETGAELLGARGTDARVNPNTRATRREKRERYYDMMDARAAAREELWMDREAGVWTDASE